MKTTSRCVLWIATFLVASLAFPVFSQQTQKDPVKLKTQLVEVRAVITNKQGQPITNLKKEDFEVLENGHPQTISFFSAEGVNTQRSGQNAGPSPAKPVTAESNAPSAPGQHASRRIAMFVDNLTMEPGSIIRAKAALAGFVDKRLTPEDEVALVATSGKLATNSQFTNNRNLLNYLINSLSPTTPTQTSLFTPYLARAIIQGERGALDAARAILTNEEMPPDPTDIHIPSGANPRTIQPGAAPPPNRSSIPDAAIFAKATTTLTESDYQRKQTLRMLTSVIERLASAPGQRMIMLLSDGVSGQEPFGGTAADLQAVVSTAARCGVVIYSIDMRGLETDLLPANVSTPVPVQPIMGIGRQLPTPKGSGSAGGGKSAPPPPSSSSGLPPNAKLPPTPVTNYLRTYVSGNANDLRAGLKILAQETGGQAFVDTNDIGGSLDKSMHDSAASYALAYYPEDLRDKRFRKISVKVKGHSDYQIRAQKGYLPSEGKEEALAETPMERLYHAMEEPFPVEGIGVETWAEYFERDGGNGQVYLHSRFAWEGSGTSDSSGQVHIKLTLASVIYDPLGNVVDEKVNQEEGALKPDRMAEAKREGFVESRQVSLKPGLYLVRTGITEEGTDKIGTALVWLNIPDLANKKMALSDVLVGGDPAETMSGAQQHPLRIASGPIRKQAARVFKTGDLMNFDFKVYNAPEDKGGTSPLQMQYEFLLDGQSVGHSQWQPVGMHQVGKDSKGLELAGGFRLNGLQPGSYTFRVVVSDNQSKAIAQSETPFVISRQ